MAFPQRTSWAPPHNINCLCVFDECREIGDLAVFPVVVDLPELLPVSSRITPPQLQTHTRTLLSPPAVASRPLPWGSKWAEYMGAFSLCQDTSNGAAFIVGLGTARGPFDLRVFEGRSVLRRCLQLTSRLLRLWGAPSQEVRCLGCVRRMAHG